MNTETRKKVDLKKLEPFFVDERGSIYDIVEAPVGHVGLVTFTKGAIRANHYHLESTQYSLVLSGTIKVTTSEVDGSNKQESILEEGMLSTVAPYIVHTYEALSEAKMLDITTLSRAADGYEKDTVRMT